MHRIVLLSAGACLSLVGWGCGVSGGAPSAARCKQTWQAFFKGEKALDCQPRGGERATSELDGQKYLQPVGTCWDFDVVALQRCGCREFLKASYCAKTGSPDQYEWRIGNSKLTDCAKYGQPPYGLSGSSEPADCRAKRTQSDCFNRKDLLFHGTTIGPCIGVSVTFTCTRGYDAQSDFLNGRCGPTPVECGCSLVEECSKPEDLACYKSWSGNPQAIECFTKNDNDPARHECYQTLKKAQTIQ